MTKTAIDDPEIAPGYRASYWKQLAPLDPNTPNSSDWSTALKIFNSRITRRFFDPADLLITSEKGSSRGTFGFAILAIDCLVMETLEGFREGLTDHTGQSRRLFRTFLLDWDEFQMHVPAGSDPAGLSRTSVC